jgi:cytidylate kinase
MPVITISRGSFSGGKMLAERLARTLDYRCLDREWIVARAAESGVSPDELRRVLLKPPTLLDRFQPRKYLYLALIQAALAEEARSGRLIYHGNAGHLLLRGGAPVLRVRVVASMEFRIAMARQRLCMDRGEAIAYIHEVDRDRRRWTQYLYGVDWTDPALYDMVINLDTMQIPEACSLVSTSIQQKRFEFTPQWQAAMDDLALSSRVRAALALDRATSHLHLQVDSRDGRVSIQGRVFRVFEMEEIRRVVHATPGVVRYAGSGVMPPLPD